MVTYAYQGYYTETALMERWLKLNLAQLLLQCNMFNKSKHTFLVDYSVTLTPYFYS